MIPIGLWGTEKVWPRRAKVPAVWNVTDPPDGHDPGGSAGAARASPIPTADTEAIMAAIVDLLPPEAREHREPTAEELAAAMPSSAPAEAAEADHEDARRPGTD